MIIGEIGGPQEAEVAEYFQKHMNKPMAAYIAGLTAPPGRLMGHAGAIVNSSSESAAEKVIILKDAGIMVSPTPSDMGKTIAALLKTSHILN
jgi:malate-CoA ligase subunit alpha